VTAPEWVNRAVATPESQPAPEAEPKKKRRRRAEAIAPTTIVDPHELDAAL
jgi:hypothetical protein